jgi:FlaA1/EpsC-like NDP-sugar epimerase
MYGEDLDWCYRIKQAGWKIYYVPDTQIIHFKGESSRNRGFRNLRSFYRSMLIFVRKRYPGRRFYPFSLLLTGGIYLRAGLEFFCQRLRRRLIPLADVLLMNVVMLGAYLIRFSQVGMELPYAETTTFLVVHSVATVVWFTSFQLSLTYTNRPYSPLTAWYGVTFSFVVLTSLTFFFKGYAFSRLASLYTWLMGSAVVMGWRVVINVFFRSHYGRSWLRKRTLIVGGQETSAKVYQQITTHLKDDYRVVGVIDDNEENLTKPVGNVRVIGTTAQLSRLVKEFDIQQLLIAPFSIPYEKILYITSFLKKERVQIKLVSEGYDTIVSKPKIERLPDIPIIKMK